MDPNAVVAYFKSPSQAISKYLNILKEYEIAKQKQQVREIYLPLEI